MQVYHVFFWVPGSRSTFPKHWFLYSWLPVVPWGILVNPNINIFEYPLVYLNVQHFIHYKKQVLKKINAMNLLWNQNQFIDEGITRFLSKSGLAVTYLFYKTFIYLIPIHSTNNCEILILHFLKQ